MNQDELKRVKDKIAAMSARTIDNGCTEAEAMVAMQKVGELLEAYNLTMSDVLLRNETFLTKIFETNRFQKHAINFCVTAIAKFCGTRVWFSYKWVGRKKQIRYNFFGTESDVDMSIYLTGMIWNMLEAETARYRASAEYKNSSTHGRSLSTSFMNGMVSRINERFSVLTEEQKSHRSTTGRDLIIVKGQLTEQKFKELGMKLRTASYSSRTSHSDSYHRGKEAGSRINLSRPVTANSSSVKLIGGR